jgi:hypothetical protein
MDLRIYMFPDVAEIQRCFAANLHYEILAKQAASMTVEYKNIDDS